jgi:hypothetical protein
MVRDCFDEWGGKKLENISNDVDQISTTLILILSLWNSPVVQRA